MNWPVKKLVAVCGINMGQSPLSSTYNKKGEGLPFYQGKKDYGERHPVPVVWCSEPTKVVESGDILISVRAPVGDLNIAQEKSCIGRGLAGLRAKKELDQNFLFLFLKFKQEYIASLGTGSTFTAISKKHLENLEIPLPPLSEQKKIVTKLDVELGKIKEAKRLREEALADTDRLLPSTLHEIFEAGKANGWEEAELESLAKSVADGTHDTPKYKTDGFPLVTSKNLRPDGLSFDTAKFISEEDYKEINKRSSVSKGDILIGMIGTIGNITSVDTDKKFSIKNVGLIRPDNSKVLAGYLLYFLDNSRLFDLIKISGSTQKFMSLGILRKIKVKYPSLAKQKQIVAKLDKLSEQVKVLRELQKAQLADLESLEKAVLREAFEQK